MFVKIVKPAADNHHNTKKLKYTDFHTPLIIKIIFNLLVKLKFSIFQFFNLFIIYSII